jgi:hypothetical protein
VAHHLEVLARLHCERVRVQPREIGDVPALHKTCVSCRVSCAVLRVVRVVRRVACIVCAAHMSGA